MSRTIMRKFRKTTKQYIMVCFISILVAGGAAAGITYKIVDEIRSESEREINACYKEMNENKRTVYIATRDIMAGEVLTEDGLRKDYVYASQPQISYVSEEDLGKDVLIDIQKDTQVLKSMITDTVVEDDIREVEFDTILISSNMLESDFVDIRIVYPNGEDYTILAKKVIKGYNGDSPNCFFWLTEEEILRMQSAVIDAYLYTGAYLYTTKYIVPNLQDATVVNYEPSVEAINLIRENPNILETATNEVSEMVRKALENRLSKSMNKDVINQQWELDSDYIFQEKKQDDATGSTTNENTSDDSVGAIPTVIPFNPTQKDNVEEDKEYGEENFPEEEQIYNGADLGKKSSEDDEKEKEYDQNYFMITEG